MTEKRYTVDNLPAVGTIYSFRLADGRYGACRVAKIVSNAGSDEWAGNCPVIVTTTYLDNEIPQLEDERLEEILRQRTIHIRDRQCVGQLARHPVLTS